MRLYIDSTELELLLESKQSYIGNQDTDLMTMIDALLLLFSAYTTSISSSRTWGIVAKTLFCAVALANIARTGWQIHQSAAHPYTRAMLLRDIEALNMQERRSSIIAIKNPVNPRRYLVYYDPQWQFLLYPNCPTRDYENESSICNILARDLAIPASDITVQFITTGTEHKYATAHGEERAYEYYFYMATVQNIPTEDFTIDNRNYRWMTTEELLADPATLAHNRYIVERVGKDC